MVQPGFFPFPRQCDLDTNSLLCTKTCPSIWRSTEVIDGTSDGRTSAPFRYSDADRINVFPVFSSEAMRVLYLNYREDVSVKGK